MNDYPYIPSQSLRKYLSGINYKFEQKEAFIITYHNKELSMGQKIKLWKEILRLDDDWQVMNDIMERINYETAKFKALIRNEKDEIYQIVQGYDMVRGYCRDWYTAIAYGQFFAAQNRVRGENASYTIKKIKLHTDVRPDWDEFGKNGNYLSGCNGSVELTYDGEVKLTESSDVTYTGEMYYSVLDPVVFPHPFKPGAKVKVKPEHIRYRWLDCDGGYISGVVSDDDGDYGYIRRCKEELWRAQYSDWEVPVKLLTDNGKQLLEYIDPIYLELDEE